MEELGKARNLLKEKEIIVRNAVRTERSLSDSSKMLKLAHEEVRSKLISVKNIDEKNEVKNLNLVYFYNNEFFNFCSLLKMKN